LYVGSFPVLSSTVSVGPQFHASCVPSALNSHINRDPLGRRGDYCSWRDFDQIIHSEESTASGYDKTG